MKKINSMAVMAVIASTLSFGTANAATYTWNANSGNWNTANNWTPSRSNANANDTMIFDGAIKATATVTYNVNAQTIGKLIIKNNAAVTFTSGSDRTLAVGNGLAGTDLQVQSGSSINFITSAANKGITLAVTSGNTGIVNGSIAFGKTGNPNQKHKLSIAGTATLSFEAGSTFTVASNYATSEEPFTSTSLLVFSNEATYERANYVVNSNDTLDQNMKVTNTLTLASGNLVIGNYNLTVSGSINGGSSASYIITNGTGVLKMNVTNANKVFPVGNTSYNPITINNSGVAGNISVNVMNAVYANGVSGALQNGAYVNRTWNVTPEASGANVTMTLQWAAADENASFGRNHVFIAHHTGTAWESMGVAPATAPAAIGSNPYTVTKSGITAFSPFTVGSAGFGPLPIHLENIEATNNGSVNEISWNTANEDAGDYMILEHSTDGKEFSELTTIYGQGNNSYYSYTDQQPATGANYYRLKMMDVNGNAVYSKTVVATVKVAVVEVTLYPNPVTDMLNIKVNSNKGEVMLFDMNGRLLNRTTVFEAGTQIDMSILPTGMYIVKYSNGTASESFNIIKK